MSETDRRQVHVRPAVESDRPAVLAIARPLIHAADTYAFEPSMDDDANQPGAGAHVADASFAVHDTQRGAGIGRAMDDYHVMHKPLRALPGSRSRP